MLLGIKTTNSVKDGIRISSVYQQPIVARTTGILKEMSGIDTINESPDNIPISVNICSSKPGLKKLPLDFDLYKQQMHAFESQLTKMPYNVSIENEWTYSYNYELTDPEKLDIITRITIFAYHFWTARGVRVSHSGTPMAMSAALVYKYYNEVEENPTKAAKFLEQWGNTPININAAKLVLEEIDRYRAAGITDMLYHLHLHCTDVTIPCLPDIIKAMKYYTTDIGAIACNELSFKDQSVENVKTAMSFLDERMPLLCAYSIQSQLLSDGTYWTNEFTPKMENAFFG